MIQKEIYAEWQRIIAAFSVVFQHTVTSAWYSVPVDSDNFFDFRQRLLPCPRKIPKTHNDKSAFSRNFTSHARRLSDSSDIHRRLLPHEFLASGMESAPFRPSDKPFIFLAFANHRSRGSEDSFPIPSKTKKRPSFSSVF